MHSENFSDHEMRILNPKPSFAGDVKNRNEVQWKRHHDHNQKGRLQKNNIAF